MIALVLFLLVIVLPIYFIPSICASIREHKKFASIMVVNLFLGWTFIGWVIALAWAFSEDNRKEETISKEKDTK